MPDDILLQCSLHHCLLPVRQPSCYLPCYRQPYSCDSQQVKPSAVAQTHREQSGADSSQACWQALQPGRIVPLSVLCPSGRMQPHLAAGSFNLEACSGCSLQQWLELARCRLRMAPQQGTRCECLQDALCHGDIGQEHHLFHHLIGLPNLQAHTGEQHASG